MLVMPLRDEAISHRQHEIQHCRRRHEALLRAIFETTLASLEINHIKQPQHHDLASFLEANNISRGRSFDPKSLPPTDSLLGYVDAPRIDYHDTRSEHKRTQDATTGEEHKLPKEGGHALHSPKEQSGKPGLVSTPAPPRDEPLSSLTDGSSALEPPAQKSLDAKGQGPKPVKELESSDIGGESTANSGLPQEPVVHSPDTHPISSDDATSIQPSVLKELVAEQWPDNSRNVHLPPKEVQEDRLEHLDRETDDGKEQGASFSARGHANAHGLTPPTSEEDVERHSTERNGQQGHDQPRPSGILKSQMDIARAEAFGDMAPTPDEQLRLEEAQSMELSKVPNGADKKSPQSMPPPASLSSEFIHDSMIDGDPIPGISDVNDGVSTRQEDSTQPTHNGQVDPLMRSIKGLRDPMFSGMSCDSSKDLTLSRRPPMRIDTGVHLASDQPSAVAGRSDAVSMPTPSESAAPGKMPPAVGNAQSPPERMTTRVSSGALRHKSVSEILGETPKVTPTQADKGPFGRESGDLRREDEHALQTPKSASSFPSPDPTTFKQRLNELKEKERSKLSTVVFASSRTSDVTQAQHLEEDEYPKKDRDYMLTLFNYQVASPPRAHQLNALVKSAHKTMTTADHLTDFNERQACRVLNKIYELQSRNSWSLRQIERSAEPKRPVTHWDVVLGEMKWMRTDFREERKWKIAAAKFTAEACAVWVACDPDERRTLQIKVRPQSVKGKSTSNSESTPDLIHSADDETSEVTDDECIRDPGNAPAAIFSLPPEMFVFGLNKSPMAEKLLLELPLYQPNAGIQTAALLPTKIEPDAAWKKDLVPLSKYAQGKIVPISNSAPGRLYPAEEGPPRKRSRFDYHQADIRQSTSRFVSDVDSEKALEPEQDDVALFDPEHKHIRDRIHTGHAFRPPSEYIMPSQSFFESRSSSQWTQAEDDELRRIVKEYSYNWSLISSSMTFPSMFSSGAERRTPWECFERWISLEGLPVEMAKINYFRAYHARLQAAQKTVESNQLAQAQQQSGNAAQLSLRRRTTQPYSVERRKDQRHLHLIDAMRKLAKKRETAASKQAQVANAAALRKAHEAPKTRKEMHTPQEFSRLKYNQQLQSEEKMRQYRAQMIHNQKVAQAAKANQQNGQQVNGLPPVRNPIPGPPNGSSPNMTATNPHSQGRGIVGDSSRAVPPMQRIVNGQTNGVLPPNAHGVPHAPMQPNAQAQMQMHQRMAPTVAHDTRVLQEVSRVQAQQQAFQQQVRQQGHPQPNGHAGSPNMQNPSLLSQNPASMLASVQGHSSPSTNGVPPPAGSSTSPRMTQPQALSSGVTPAINHITSQVKARHPQASPEQITRMTTDQLYQMSEARRNAMQAAAGNANLNAVANNSNIGLQAHSPMQQAALMANAGSPILNSAHYAQIMRSQQASQQRGANTGGGQGMNGNNVNGNGINGNGMNGAARNGSRSATPMIQRTGSAQGGTRPSQSPSARPVGLA